MNIDDGSIIGLESVPRIELSPAIRTYRLPVPAARQHHAAKARPCERAARDRDEAPSATVHNTLLDRSRELDSHRKLVSHSERWWGLGHLPTRCRREQGQAHFQQSHPASIAKFK